MKGLSSPKWETKPRKKKKEEGYTDTRDKGISKAMKRKEQTDHLYDQTSHAEAGDRGSGKGKTKLAKATGAGSHWQSFQSDWGELETGT